MEFDISVCKILKIKNGAQKYIPGVINDPTRTLRASRISLNACAAVNLADNCLYCVMRVIYF